MTTNFPGGVSSFGMPVLPGVRVPFTGKVYFVNPATGNDGNDGLSPEVGRAFATLYRAHAECVSGNHDVVFLVGNGGTTGTARLSIALALAETTRSGATAATSGKLIWSKSATHLIGISAGGNVSGRARVAPPSGTYTAATFASNDMVLVSGDDCFISNIDFYQSFSTGNASERCVVVTGQRNFFENCHINGINTAAAAGAATSRSLVIDGSAGSYGENKFVNCVIGGDTGTARGNFANASVELKGATPRNQFIGCIFTAQCSGAGPLHVLTTGAGAIDRWTLFEDCKFINNIKSTSTQMTVAMSMDNAAPGGLFLIHNCLSIGNTKWGDTNALANSFVQVGYAAGTTGLGAVPS
jgi:hypothetical protein